MACRRWNPSNIVSYPKDNSTVLAEKDLNSESIPAAELAADDQVALGQNRKENIASTFLSLLSCVVIFTTIVSPRVSRAANLVD